MNPFLKNLNDNDLIREATRLGITVDDLKAQQMAPSPEEMNPYDEVKMMKQAQEPVPQSGMNPMVEEYLLKKMAKPTITEDSDQPLPAQQKTPSLLDQFSPEKYQQALAKMKEQQSNTGLSQLASGIGDALARRDPSASDKYYQDLRSNIQDQTTGEFGRQKAMAVSDVKTKNELAKTDPNSIESVNFRKLVQSTMPRIAQAYGDNFDQLTAADSDKILDYGKMRELIDARKEETRMKMEMLKESGREKSEAKALKVKELNTTQSKQLGLYNSGKAAEQMYLDASNTKEYNPTQNGQFIDNSTWAPNMFKNDKAIESSNAQEAWVESFLRDASGAAIPPSERGSYKAIFFPQPGDTEKAVANKKALRDEKMRSAAAGAGINHDSATIPTAPNKNTDNNVKIDSFMKKNRIIDRSEAVRILKYNGKI